MKKLLVILAVLGLTACGKEFATVETQTSAPPPSAQPMPDINININIGGDTINNSNNNDNTSGGGNATGGSGNATGGSSTNNNTNNNDQDISVDQDQDVDIELGVRSGRFYRPLKNPPVSNDGKPKKVFVNGLKCKVYDLAATKPSKIPDYSTMAHVALIEIDRLDVVKQNYSAGFPKFPSPLRESMLEWYGMRCEGFLNIPATDIYTLYLTSDDGSKLYIKKTLFLDNDGTHATLTKQNSAFLKKGRHAIMIDYFQGPKVEISLVLEMQSSTMPRQVVPASNLQFKK